MGGKHIQVLSNTPKRDFLKYPESAQIFFFKPPNAFNTPASTLKYSSDYGWNYLLFPNNPQCTCYVPRSDVIASTIIISGSTSRKVSCFFFLVNLMALLTINFLFYLFFFYLLTLVYLTASLLNRLHSCK